MFVSIILYIAYIGSSSDPILNVAFLPQHQSCTESEVLVNVNVITKQTATEISFSVGEKCNGRGSHKGSNFVGKCCVPKEELVVKCEGDWGDATLKLNEEIRCGSSK